jgi:hypothetical protein
MKIFLYSPAGDPSGDRLGELIKTNLPEAGMVVCRTLRDLSQSLRQPAEDSGVAVLLVSDQEDLKNIISIRYLFQNIRIILLLPTKEAEIVAMAHQLRPRFLTGRNSDLAEVTAVLKKMFKDRP